MGFTKLEDDVLDGSIVAHGIEVFGIWCAILSRTKPVEGATYGLCTLTIPACASLFRLPVERVRAAYKILASPDQDSRSKEFDGRRIQETEGGWKVLNYGKRRENMLLEAHREYEASRKREQRSVSGDVRTSPDVSGDGRTPSASASASASVVEGGVGETRRANPLMKGRREVIEGEILKLVGLIHEATGEAQEEILREGQHYPGARRSAINPASMSDDRLLNTVMDLRSRWAGLQKEQAKRKAVEQWADE